MKNANQQRIWRRAHNLRGLTLAELMVVIALLGVLATIIFGSLTGVFNEGKKDAAKIQIAKISQAVEMYHARKAKYPKSLEDAKSLMTDQKVPSDPWGKLYEYSSSGSSCGKKFEVRSLGEDGTKSEDDITNCDDENKK